MDGNILLWIQDHFRWEGMNWFWKGITSLGNGGWFWIVLCILMVVLVKISGEKCSIKNENSFKKIKTIKSTGSKRITYVDNTCESIRSYKYYVVAYNGSDKSAKSNIDSDVYGYFENDDVPLYLTISKGEVYKDIHQKLKEYGAETFFVWSSSDSKVVKVSSDSIITGVSKGTATLTARGSGSYKNRHVYIIVTVK